MKEGMGEINIRDRTGLGVRFLSSGKSGMGESLGASRFRSSGMSTAFLTDDPHEATRLRAIWHDVSKKIWTQTCGEEDHVTAAPE